MATELAPIDITQFPELARVIAEVRTTRKPRRITCEGEDVALLIPAPTAASAQRPRPSRPLRFPKGGLVAATAGIVQYDGPVLSRKEEKDALPRA